MKVARLDCTYKEKNGKITVLFNGSTKDNIFEYNLSKKNAITKIEKMNLKPINKFIER